MQEGCQLGGQGEFVSVLRKREGARKSKGAGGKGREGEGKEG